MKILGPTWNGPENFDLEDQCFIIYGEEVMFLYCQFNFQIYFVNSASIQFELWSLLLISFFFFLISLLSCSIELTLFSFSICTCRHEDMSATFILEFASALKIIEDGGGWRFVRGSVQ